jgi:osmotically-inducible protein OsmY
MSAAWTRVPNSTLYTPSTDSELETRICSFLRQRHVPHCGRVRLRAHGGAVVVSGRLSSRHAKWLCMECCRHVAGVIKLVDHVKLEGPRGA